MTASAPTFPDVEQLRRVRDREVIEAERDTPCTCTSRASFGGRMVELTHDGCWLHDPEARRKHLDIAVCECCEAEVVVSSMSDGGWCWPCEHEAGPVEGPFTPDMEF